MTHDDYVRKVAELDRLINDPGVAIQPALIWRLLGEIAKHDSNPGRPHGDENPGLVAIDRHVGSGVQNRHPVPTD